MDEARKKKLEARIDKLDKSVESAKNVHNTVADNVSVELHALRSTWRSFGLDWGARINPRQEQQLEHALQRAEAAVQSIARANPDHGSINHAVSMARGELASATVQLLLFGLIVLNREDKTIQKLDAASQAKLNEWEKKHAELDAKIKSSITEAENAVQVAKEAARRAGIAEKVTAFSTAERNHGRWALFWGFATLGASAALLSAVGGALDNQPPLPKEAWHLAGNLAYYLPRAVITLVLSSLMVFCAKNFRAAKHNEVINQHRSNALATFETLHAASSRGAANAITLYAANAAFATQASGYATPESGPRRMPEFVENLDGLQE